MKETHRILLADDDESILDAMSLMLETMDYKVESIRDGAKVVAALTNPPDLIILDTWMSGIDGRDVCRDIKSNSTTQSIPILMISASHEIKESALVAGADRFMAKPFEMEEFLTIVEEMIHHK